MAFAGVYTRGSSIHGCRRQHQRTLPAPSNVLCRFWVQGRCSRRPCPFRHGGTDPPRPVGRRSPGKNLVWKNPNAVPPATAAAAAAAPTSMPPQRQTKRVEEKKTDADAADRAPPGKEDLAAAAQTPRQTKSDEEKRTESADSAPPGKEDLAAAQTETVAAPLDAAKPDAAAPISPNRAEAPRPPLSVRRAQAPPPLSINFLNSFCGGHTGRVTGIAMPRDSDGFFTGGDDGIICVWKNLAHGRGEQTPEQVIHLGSPVSCLIAEGICVFAGARGGVHACNVLSKAGLFLPIPAGQVTSLAATDQVLFAGADDGNILAWKMIPERDHGGKLKDVRFQPAVRLSGHASAVTCLAVAGSCLISGAQDGSIRAWNVTSPEDVKELDVPPAAHQGAVTSMIRWGPQYLLSASLDGAIKVWCGIYEGVDDTLVGLKQVYVRRKRQGVVFLWGTDDGADGPVLLCSLADGTVQLYHLPTFVERGTIHCTSQAVAMHSVQSAVLIGEASGDVSRWSFSTRM